MYDSVLNAGGPDHESKPWNNTEKSARSATPPRSAIGTAPYRPKPPAACTNCWNRPRPSPNARLRPSCGLSQRGGWWEPDCGAAGLMASRPSNAPEESVRRQIMVPLRLWGGDANGNGGIRPLVAVTELSLAICAPTVRCTGCGNPTCMGRRAGVASRLERDDRVSPAHQDRRLAAWEPARTASCVRIDTELADTAIAPAVRDAIDRQTARMP